IGIHRFLNRVWYLVTEKDPLLGKKSKKKKKEEKLIVTAEAKRKLKENLKNLERTRHKTIKKVTEDLEKLHFNTAISSLMEYVNQLYEVPLEKVDKKHLESLVLLLSPFAPHLSEELWNSYLKHRKSVTQEKWPTFKPHLTEEIDFVLIAQINGKTRAKIKIKKGINKVEAEKLAKSFSLVKKYLSKKKIKKVIFVKDKLINFVI
ncbi:MAG: class I tRNA ligase family protein, partial [Candidatus Pacebacteria bacterium]|nr:class I tRNA ligase family protein [Candidatus Paceibacterota bacterium]